MTTLGGTKALLSERILNADPINSMARSIGMRDLMEEALRTLIESLEIVCVFIFLAGTFPGSLKVSSAFNTCQYHVNPNDFYLSRCGWLRYNLLVLIFFQPNLMVRVTFITKYLPSFG